MLSVLAVSAALLLSAPSAPKADSRNDPALPDLIGRVLNGDGTPVHEATVYIWTARAKVGYSVFCPSCYLDCGKRASTVVDGFFAIKDLDPELLFRVLVIADNHVPTFVSNVDPAAGPISARLEHRVAAPPDAPNVLHGVVVNPKGEPVEGAVIEPRMVWFVGGGGRGGQVEGLDPLAVTNAKGEFELRFDEPCAAMELLVNARGFATLRVSRAPCGDHRTTMTMAEGAAITGRVVRDGKPVPGVLVVASQTNRSSRSFLGSHTIGTDEDGRFRFDNIPVADDVPAQTFNAVDGTTYTSTSTREWAIGVAMSSMRDAVFSTRIIQVDKNAFEFDVGDLTVAPGLTFAGKVILADDKALPEGSRIQLSRDTVWDTLIVPLSTDGAFRIEHLVPDSYSISPSIKGYHPSPKSPSLSHSYQGVINADVLDFTMFLEPGADAYQHRLDSPTNRLPFQSIDTSLPDLQGHVLSSLGTPVAGARVAIWALTPKGERFTYSADAPPDAGRAAISGSDGRFRIRYVERDVPFALLVSAKGYQSRFVRGLSAGQSDHAITLQTTHSSPDNVFHTVRGRVINSGSQPIAGAAIQTRCVRLDDGSVTIAGFDPLVVTNAKGEFIVSYDAPCETMEFNVDAPGYATRIIQGAACGPALEDIQLDEGVTVSGRVLQDGQPLPNVRVVASQPNGTDGVRFGPRFATTKSDGTFRFDHVPLANASAQVTLGLPDGRQIPLPNPRQWGISIALSPVPGPTSASRFVDVNSTSGLTQSLTIEAGRSRVLAGRVVLADKSPLPPTASLELLRVSNLDALTIPLTPDGSFRFPALPEDAYLLFPKVEGYSIAPENPSFARGIEGLLDDDLPDLIILLQPGDPVIRWGPAPIHPWRPFQNPAPVNLPSNP